MTRIIRALSSVFHFKKITVLTGIMLWIALSWIALLMTQTLAAKGSAWQAPPPAKNDPIPVGNDGKYTIVAEGIRAQFIPYGASLTNLFINDTNGVERDIVLGYDNATYYTQDASHPHLGGVPGKWARIIVSLTNLLDPY